MCESWWIPSVLSTLTHNELRALETCTAEAGFVKDEIGRATDKKARVQVVIINALSKWSSRKNRRAHDKLIITDGLVPDQAVVMTGGRNVSVSYYGIHDDGTPDPTAYQDLEIILRSNPQNSNEHISVGDVATSYYTMLFLHEGNKRLRPVTGGGNAHKISDRNNLDTYRQGERKGPGKIAVCEKLVRYREKSCQNADFYDDRVQYLLGAPGPRTGQFNQ
jgi:hypothetical protein